jgi:hypothetical protein
VEVHGDGSGVFRLTGLASAQSFGNAQAALQAAHSAAQQAAVAAVQGMGAAQPEVEVSEHKSYYPNAVDERGLMQAVVTARAVGRP